MGTCMDIHERHMLKKTIFQQRYFIKHMMDYTESVTLGTFSLTKIKSRFCKKKKKKSTILKKKEVKCHFHP
ncbi:hypothetical protein Hanom_Chr03g00274011 [Helianthus anomalus]